MHRESKTIKKQIPLFLHPATAVFAIVRAIRGIKAEVMGLIRQGFKFSGGLPAKEYMKAIKILLAVMPFIAMAQDRAKIDLGTETIHGQPKSLDNLCNPIGAEARNELINRYFKTKEESHRISLKVSKAIDIFNKYTQKINAIKRGKVLLSDSQWFEFNKLSKLINDYRDKYNRNVKEGNRLWELNKKAYNILIRTAAKGRPSLYGLKVITEAREDYLKSGRAKQRLKYQIEMAKLRKQQYLIYKEAKDRYERSLAWIYRKRPAS